MPRSRPAPANAFRSEFLDDLRGEDELPNVQEVEYGGPWRLRKAPAGYDLLRFWQDRDQADLPAGTFASLDLALLFLAAMPALGRPAELALSPEPSRQGFALYRGGEVAGFLPFYHEEMVDTVSRLAAVASSVVGQAALLSAAGPRGIELVGELLSRRAFVEEVGAEWPEGRRPGRKNGGR